MPRIKPAALRSTFRIESDDPASLALALKARIATSDDSARRSGRARSTVRHVRCGSVTLATDSPESDLIAATRAALRAARTESATVWTGSSGVEITAAMDDARLATAAIMLGTLAAAPAPAGELPGVPVS